jgi:hypothetical protein
MEEEGMSEFINLGLDLDTGLPVLERAVKLACSNSLVMGRTGTGKSTTWALKLLTNFMDQDATVIVFDGAQWPFMYHAVKLLAKAAGRRFRAIFDSGRYEGCKFDPFQQFVGVDPSELEIARLLVRAASVEMKNTYGVQWFGLSCYKAAMDAAAALLRRRAPITLQSILQTMTDQARHSRDAEQILYALLVIAAHQTIAPDDGSGDFIDWREAEDERQVVLVSYDAANPGSNYFATAIHASLTTHAQISMAMGTNRVQKILICDEWVTLLGGTYAQSLTQERKRKVSHHLLNQGRYQMDFIDPDLAKLVLDQVQYQLHMSPDFETQEYIQTNSKLTGTMLSGKAISNNGVTISEREQRERVLELNRILDIGHTFGAGILIRDTQDGFKEPTALFIEHDMPKSVFEAFDAKPFPLRPKVDPPKATPGPVRDDAWKAREAAIKAIFEARLAWQSGLS